MPVHVDVATMFLLDYPDRLNLLILGSYAVKFV